MNERVVAAATVIRPPSAADHSALRALVTELTALPTYDGPPAYFLGLALADLETEVQALVADRGGAVVGCVLFGRVAGTVGTGKLHYVAVAPDARRIAIGTRLCATAVADLTSRGARSVVAELPDDSAFEPGRALLERCGFTEVARVADYYRDAIDLLILRHGPWST